MAGKWIHFPFSIGLLLMVSLQGLMVVVLVPNWVLEKVDQLVVLNWVLESVSVMDLLVVQG